MRFTLTAPLSWQERPIKILMLGMGGNGSCLGRAVYRIHQKILATGHEYGIDLTVADGAEVSFANTKRQCFWENDLGELKASLAVDRYNLWGYNVSWTAIDRNLSASEVAEMMHFYDILITCVDKAQIRCEIHDQTKDTFFANDPLWLDLGNESETGNIIIGHLGNPHLTKRVPNVVDLYPEHRNVIDNPKRSCSAMESFAEQNVLTNQFCADIAAKVLLDLVCKGQVRNSINFFDLSNGIDVNSLPIDTELWERMYGYRQGVERLSA
jgi:PRTRC genetic system ThiF family protein